MGCGGGVEVEVGFERGYESGVGDFGGAGAGFGVDVPEVTAGGGGAGIQRGC